MATSSTDGTEVSEGIEVSEGTEVSDKNSHVGRRIGKRVKPNFELFIEDPKAFFTENVDLEHYEKGLYGFCAARKSFRHALILLSVRSLTSKRTYDPKDLRRVSLDNKNIIMNLITTKIGPNDDPKKKVLGSFLIPEKDESFVSVLPSFYSITISSFVSDLIESIENPDERLYTLAIRFYCTYSDYDKGSKLYEKLLAAKVEPHSRTFLPLLGGCQSYKDLVGWHDTALLNLDHPPSLEFYEVFFERLFCLTDPMDTQPFMREFERYQFFYPFITPGIARLFKSKLRHRKDLRIMADGLVYVEGDPRMADHKLDRIDITFERKKALASCFAATGNGAAIAAFEAYVQRRGNSFTWDIVLDAANIALYNNSETFRYDRIISILKWALGRGYRVLTILHCSRKENNLVLENFINKNEGLSIYYTPVHHNDDHFWLYAALSRDAFVLSNDEMHDHAFLIRTSTSAAAPAAVTAADETSTDMRRAASRDDFQVWRMAHQIFYSFDRFDRYEIFMPSKFSRVIQVIAESRIIHAPVYDPNKNPPHYLQNQDLIEGWISLEY